MGLTTKQFLLLAVPPIALISLFAALRTSPSALPPRADVRIQTPLAGSEAAPLPSSPGRPAPAEVRHSPSREAVVLTAKSGDEQTRKNELYALAPREPLNPDITRQIVALITPEESVSIRVAAYTSLRFRRDDAVAVEALLAAFPKAGEPERRAAAQSLGFQNLPGVADRVQALLPDEPSPGVRAALVSALDHLLKRIPPMPCLTKPKP
ncbi:MAG TPA: hypothetical protein VE981_20000 [Planctomycetota bacterium]|nr:hypothetical protein [Planctomycetota bacterium]